MVLSPIVTLDNLTSCFKTGTIEQSTILPDDGNSKLNLTGKRQFKMAEKSNKPMRLIECARKAVLTATGIDKSKDVLKELNLPKCVIQYLTNTFSSSDFYINKDNVTPEDVESGIYKAVCCLDNTAVVLKILDFSELTDERKQSLAKWETATLNGVQRCYTSFNEDAKRIFVFQHVTRADEVIKRCRDTGNRLSDGYVWFLLHQVSQEMKNCVENGLEYKDFRTYKIGFLSGGEILLENNILCLDEEEGAMQNMIMDDGVPVGVYSPSEVINEEELSFKSLVWQIGVVVYEMAALRPAYQIEDASDVFTPLGEIMEGSLPPALNRSDELNTLLNQCMSLEQDSRPTLQQLIDLSLPKFDDSVKDELKILL